MVFSEGLQRLSRFLLMGKGKRTVLYLHLRTLLLSYTKTNLPVLPSYVFLLKWNEKEKTSCFLDPLQGIKIAGSYV